MENKSLIQNAEQDQLPITMKEREFEIFNSQSRRMRITSTYLTNQTQGEIKDKEGFYQGDIMEQVIFPEDQQKQALPQKKVIKHKHGKGVHLFPNGDLYNGDWDHGKMHGQGGFYFSAENHFYKGEFTNNELTGRGVFFYSDTQDYYLGELQQGKFHGKGLYYRRQNNMWELNEYSEGRILKTIKAGEGRPQSLEISKEIVQDDPFFQEIYIKPKDMFFEHYEGDIVNGKKDGNGIAYHRDGSRYEGTWKLNKPNGVGVTVYSDQKFDIGEYKDGFLHGLGRSQFHNRDIYRGQFYKGRMQGLGLYLYSDTKQWVFCYFKSNNIGKEFERGALTAYQKNLPDYTFLEQKYKGQVNRHESDQDVEYIDNQMQMSNEKRRKSMFSSSNDDVSPDKQSPSPSKKKMLNILIEEKVQKKSGDNSNTSYCLIF